MLSCWFGVKMVKKMIKYLAFKEKRKLTYLKGAKKLTSSKKQGQQ